MCSEIFDTAVCIKTHSFLFQGIVVIRFIYVVYSGNSGIQYKKIFSGLSLLFFGRNKFLKFSFSISITTAKFFFFFYFVINTLE